MKSSVSCSTSAVDSARVPVSASSDGPTGASPVSATGERRPAWCSCAEATAPKLLMRAASRVSPARCSSPKMPSCPGKPWPMRCTCAAQVMTRPNPPLARYVSQLCSSSEMRPSVWLCKFVNGANMKRFLQTGPRRSGNGSNNVVIGFREWLGSSGDGRNADRGQVGSTSTDGPIFGQDRTGDRAMTESATLSRRRKLRFFGWGYADEALLPEEESRVRDLAERFGSTVEISPPRETEFDLRAPRVS